MKCIFCKGDSSSSKSIEHIIPESLGNKSHTLAAGIVCDRCNNYFALKIEKALLELPYFQSLRGRNWIANKRGRIPGLPGFVGNDPRDKVQVLITEQNLMSLVVENKVLFEKIFNGECKQLNIPIYDAPPSNNEIVSKFIGKIALEALAERVSHIDNWQNDFIENEGLDSLRNFVRFGNGSKIWPYHQRSIYKEDEKFIDQNSDEKEFQILHEYDFLIPEAFITNGEYRTIENIYFVCAILGFEYTINLTESGLDSYLIWLDQNQNKSILRMTKQEFNNFNI